MARADLGLGHAPVQEGAQHQQQRQRARPVARLGFGPVLAGRAEHRREDRPGGRDQRRDRAAAAAGDPGRGGMGQRGPAGGVARGDQAPYRVGIGCGIGYGIGGLHGVDQGLGRRRPVTNLAVGRDRPGGRGGTAHASISRRSASYSSGVPQKWMASRAISVQRTSRPASIAAW